MDKWIANPKAILPDSPMAAAFQGIPDENERADIIAYLKTQWELHVEVDRTRCQAAACHR
jgi:cytochrome c2